MAKSGRFGVQGWHDILFPCRNILCADFVEAASDRGFEQVYVRSLYFDMLNAAESSCQMPSAIFHTT
jgi:hypothetical protein